MKGLWNAMWCAFAFVVGAFLSVFGREKQAYFAVSKATRWLSYRLLTTSNRVSRALIYRAVFVFLALEYWLYKRVEWPAPRTLRSEQIRRLEADHKTTGGDAA